MHFVGSCGADHPAISFEALLTGHLLFEAQQLTTLERNGCCLLPRRYKYISIFVQPPPSLLNKLRDICWSGVGV